MPSLKERAKTLIELIAGAYFIFADRPLEIEPKAAALLTPETRALIGQLRTALEAVTDWSAETTEAAMRNFAEQNNLKLGAVAQPLRVALTGRTTSPGIFDVLAVLGREECLARLGDQAGRLRPLPYGDLRPSCSAQGNKLRHLTPPSRQSGLPCFCRKMAPGSARFSQRFHRGLHDGRKIQQQDRNAHGRQQDLRFPDPERHGRARCHRHRQALRPGRDVHLRPRLHLDRQLPVEDHLYRRRRRRAGIPRLSDRAARRKGRLPRDLLSAALRGASDRRRRRRISTTA